ncbi:MAG TPA: FG-GAP-like repeat-containing protein, partial [Bryobacteraceae bacterium]|nr:FG-GAP-like repeat-containing protein [Bryobacteraceae bacterium]
MTCTPGSGTVTCTGGAGVSVNVTGNSNGTAQAGTPFPSTIAVSGGGSAVTSVSLTLHGYTSVSNLGSSPALTGSRDMGLLLVAPDGTNFELMRCVGLPSNAQSNIDVTLQDGATQIPPCGGTGAGNWTAGGTFSPSSNTSNLGLPSHPDYTLAGGPALQTGHYGPNNGSDTLNSVNGVFTGKAVNGNWSLYLVSDAQNTTRATHISFSSWDITLTFTAASVSSTTTLTPNPTTVFTSSPNNTTTLTATVTGSAGTPTGTVTFKDGSNNLTCSGGNPAPLSGGTATCATSVSSEGLHSLAATYSGDGTYITSNGSANIFAYNHASNSGNTYCNNGALGGTGSALSPYPSVIYVGDGANSPAIGSNQVNTVSVTLNSLSTNCSNCEHMLLVSPDGTHALDFWGEPGGGATSGNYTIQDGAAAFPQAPPSPGTYAPTSNLTTDTFSSPANPAPHPPSSFSLAQPAGSKTFSSSFSGAQANGAWSLYIVNNGTSQSLSAAGWCLNISPASGKGTSVTLQSSPTNASKGSSVQFTATVGGGVGNTGTVTFTENGTPLTGAPNNGVAIVSNGSATISTSSLPEGDHTVTASYHDSTNTFNDSNGSTTMRVDAATATPTLSNGAWSYCNTAGVSMVGTQFVNDIGPFTPNPSNIFVTNLPGTINSISLTLKNFSITSPGDLDSLLVGPNGASAPTAAQTLDFFSGAGGNGGSTAFNHNQTFTDASGPVSCSASGPAPGGSNAPTSCVSTSYTASPFYTLPASFQHATTQGNFTFNTGTYNAGVGGGVYANTLGNGTWSLYFNQLIHHSLDGATAWCMNFTENPVSAGVTEAHVGSDPNNHFVQGENGAQITTAIQNNGTGPTGDPDQSDANAITVVHTLPSGVSYSSVSGTDWACTTNLQTVTCVNHDAIQQGSSYPTLTLTVNVSTTATPGTFNNNPTVSGGGITSTSGSDSITIDAAPDVTVTAGHTGTFTQGSTGAISLQAHNIAPSSVTTGTTTIVDTLPTGWTLANNNSTADWTCGSAANVITCTSTAQISGGNDFPALSLTVNIPTTSPASVQNNATISGGGELNTANDSSPADSITVIQVPASVNITAGNNQSATVGTAFSTALTVVIKDAASVTIPSTSVTFTAPASGASGKFSNSTNTITANTDSNGQLGETFTANGQPGGPYQVTAAAGTVSASFNLTNTLTGYVETISAGDAQNAAPAQAFAIPLQVKVLNGATPSTNANVLFTINPGSKGASATFPGNATSVTVQTDSSGLATAPTLTANGTRGNFTVTASLQSINVGSIGDSTSQTFHLTVGLATSIVLNAPSLTNSALSQPVTLSATISPNTANGNVTFYDGSSIVGYSFSSGGISTLTTPFLPAGANAITAIFDGGGSYGQSSLSTRQTVTVTPYYGLPLGAPAYYGVPVQGSSVLVADFNGDGKPDVLKLNSDATEQSFNVLLGKGDGTFAGSAPNTPGAGKCTAPGPAITCDAGGIAVFGVIGDFNGDGKPDLAISLQSGGGVNVFLGNGDGTFSAPVNYSVPNAYRLAVADFDGDGISDLVVTEVSGAVSGAVQVLLGNGDGTFLSPSTAATTGGGPVGVAVGDFNQDGRPDIATVNAAVGTVSVLLGNGDGTFGSSTDQTVGTFPEDIVVGHFASATNLDIAVVNGSDGTVSVLPGNGNGTFQQQMVSSIASGAGPASLAVGDFNGDGTSDLAVANQSVDSVSILLGNGDGSFQNPVNSALDSGSAPNSIAVGDFNADGHTDLVVNNSGAASVAVLQATIPSMSKTAGDNQSTNVGTQFATNLQVKVLDSSSNPVPNIAVTFTPPATAASGAFTGSSTVLTNSSGVATAPPYTANSTAGADHVTASAAGISPVTFNLTNTQVEVPPTIGAYTAPAGGGGMSGQFQFQFSDGNGAADIARTWMVFNATLSPLNACQLTYIASVNRLYLMSDDSKSWVGFVTPGGSGTLHNSQCTLNAPTSTVSASGNTLTITVDLSFTQVFGGIKQAYAYVLDAETETAGWTDVGTWMVGPPPTEVAPQVGTLTTPAGGFGTSGQFQFQFS